MKRFALTVLFLCAAATAAADDDPYYKAPPKWSESEITWPAFPKPENLIEFYVSATTRNHFFIDGSSLSVGADGVVRYVLVVKTAGGATDISFEGIRCSSGEYRLYAIGRSNDTWAKTRVVDWRPIENKTVNRYHAALYGDYFCPDHTSIVDAVEGKDALRRGRHPGAR